MRQSMIKAAIGLFAVGLVGNIAMADETAQVTVQASRTMVTTAGRTSSGVPIVDVSLSYGVSAADLDLSGQAGAVELEKRVKDAAQAACKEIGRQYPDAQPSDTACVRASVDEAMIRVRELVAAPHQGPTG